MRRFLRPARIPWVMLGITVALVAASVALGLSSATETDLFIALSIAALSLVFGVTGALVASRMPENLVGWIFCAFALLFESGNVSEAYVAYGSQAGGLLPGRTWVEWTNQWSGDAIFPVLFVSCFLLFPTGRLPSARWRPVVWLVATAAAVQAVSAALAPGVLRDYGSENPVGMESAPVLRTISEVSGLVLVTLMFVSVASLFVRLRRSSGIERLQLKWFAYAAALVVIHIVAGEVLALLFGRTLDHGLPNLIIFATFAVTISGIPIAMGVAVLRYRLYDIDLIVNRTLVYGVLTGMLALVYFGGVATTQAVLRALTGQGDLPQLAIVASTLVIAALFNPLRRRIQAFIDRRFYRRKYDAKETLEEFSRKLRDETDLDELSGDLVRVVRETVQPEHVSLWFREKERDPGGAEARS
jgi:hypothetical protein